MSPVTNEQRGFNPMAVLGPGTPAPDFTLRSTPDQFVSLSELRGAPVILAFYPADWSPVCGDQMALYNEILPEFRRLNAALLGISVDGIWCHLRSPRIASCGSPCWRISSQKVPSRVSMAPIASRTGFPSGPCSCSMRRERFGGTIYLLSASTRGPMGFSRLSKRFPPNSRCRPERETVDSGTSGSHLCAELVRMGGTELDETV